MNYNFCGSAVCQPDRRCPGYIERPEVRSYIRILEYPISSQLYRYRNIFFFKMTRHIRSQFKKKKYFVRDFDFFPYKKICAIMCNIGLPKESCFHLNRKHSKKENIFLSIE